VSFQTATSFVGRRTELATVRSLLGSSRLVTIHGPGGIGKTRLAEQLGSLLRRAFAQRVWTVELAAVDSGGLVAAAVASAMGLSGSRAPIELVTGHIQQAPALLILDNCEHVVEAVAALVDRLLSECGGLKVLATSREPLALSGETTYPVPSMGSEAVDVDDAMRLFADRAGAVRPGFTLDQHTARLVRTLVRRLDGLPLAIELAAARTRSLALEELLERLDDPLDLLSTSLRNSPQRHRTMRSSIEWSYDLCSVEERTAWAMLSTFAGSFDLAAAGALLSGAGDLFVTEAGVGDFPDPLGPGSPLDLVDGLVTKSILEATEFRGRMRFRMLGPLRQFGVEQLPADVRARLAGLAARHYGAILRDLELTWSGPAQAERLAHADEDLPNIRQAIRHSLAATEDSRLLVELAVAPSAELWWAAGHLEEGRYWLDQIAEHGELPDAVRSEAKMGLSTLAIAKGELARARALILEAVELSHTPDDPGQQARVRFNTAFCAILAGDPTAAIGLLRDALQIVAQRPLEHPSHLRFRQMLVYALNGIPDDDRAATLCREMLALGEERREAYYQGFALNMLALYTWRAGDPTAAHALMRQALTVFADFPNRPENPDALLLAGFIESALGRDERAAVLFGAAEATARTRVTSTALLSEAHADGPILRARLALLRERFADAWARGTRMAPADAVAFALGGDSDPAPDAPGPGLTRREREVAALIAQGCSNREIAAALVIAPRTAEGHVERLLRKLGLSSRTQLAAWAHEHDIQPDGST
jgi:non-specific serine/threonine protein kinase